MIKLLRAYTITRYHEFTLKYLILQTFSASLVLREDLQIATLNYEMIQEFAKTAANEFSTNASEYWCLLHNYYIIKYSGVMIFKLV